MITNPSNFRDLHDCYDFIEAGHLYRSALPSKSYETGLGQTL